MPKPTEAALRKLRRKFMSAQTAGRLSGRARLAWKVIKAPGKVKPPYRLYPVDALNGKDLTRQVGGVGFTPTPRKKVIRRASRTHVESLTLAQIDRALIIWNGNQTRAAKSLSISPSTLVRLRLELLEQQVAEQHATVPSPAPTPAAPTMAADPDDEELAADARRIEAGLARQAAGASADVHPVTGGPVATDDPPSCTNCRHAHAQGTVCPVSDCNCGDEVDVPPGNAGDCTPAV